MDAKKISGMSLIMALDSTIGEVLGWAWQPIASAPKDGTHILIWDGEIECVAKFDIWFTGHEGAWECVGASGYDIENAFKAPTYWMPLPPPPDGK
jgi:hypothetical protein